MIPWQIVAALIGLLAVQMILSYFRSGDASEEARAQANERCAAYRAAHRDGFNHGCRDAKRHDEHDHGED